MFSDVDMIISCGDLPYYYLEYILDMLNVPMFFVHGNHDPVVEIGSHGSRSHPWGAENLHGRLVNQDEILLLGFEGSIRYSKARYQYTQSEMWLIVMRMVPRLVRNRLVRGRYLDILVTHSPALGFGVPDDPAHQGFAAFRWLLKVFKPRYHLHGHVHIYDRNENRPVEFMETTIINTSTFHQFDFEHGVENG
jgi:Icc-related predicted phosphoesterase